MQPKSIRDALLEERFVRGFTPQQIDRLEQYAKFVDFEANRVIFSEGEECDEFYLIVSGRVALEIVPQGEPLRIETLSAGDEFGWSTFLEGTGKLFRARTLLPVKALVFDGAQLRQLCESDPAFGYVLMRRVLSIVAERLQSARLQVLDNYWPAAKRAGN
jgi:CRP-like cAMP-binding protein